MLATLVLAVILILIFILKTTMKPPNYPSGPDWLPLFGSSRIWKQTIAKHRGFLHKAFLDLATQNGNPNILGLKLGKEHLLIIGGWELITKSLTSEEYDGRPNNFFMRLRCFGERQGITGTDGSNWTSLRSFTVRHLKNLGFGRRELNLLVSNEVKIFSSPDNKHLKDLSLGLSLGLINVLWCLIAGHRLDDDAKVKRVLDILKRRNKAFNMAGGLLNEMPWLRFIFPKWVGYNLILKLNNDMKSIFQELIEEKQKTYKNNKNRSFIDAFLHEMENRGDDSRYFTISQLIMICMDLFIAGSQTTSINLEHAFLMMILHPEVQAKVQEELDRVVGRDRDPDIDDRTRLPYTEAVLLECQRYCSITPFFGPRRILRDTELDGYFICKNTTVLLSSHTIHHDKKFWGDPEIFRPERFLGKNEQLINTERVVTFGIGRRTCLGEILARVALFLFFSTMLHKYQFSKNPKDTNLDDQPMPGIILTPKPHTPLLKPRF